MDLELNDDQAELRAIAKDLFQRRGGLKPARDLLEGRANTGALAAELMELGWASVGLDEDDSFGVPGLCLLAEQVGAHVAPVGLVDSAVVARLSVDVAGIPSDGSASLCVLEAAAGWSLTDLSATASLEADGRIRLNAHKVGVHHARVASAYAVLAVLDGEPAAVLVSKDAHGVQITATASVDPSADPATVLFDDVLVSGAAVITGAPLLKALAVGTVATAAEAVGAANRALEMAVAYALERHQFGRPIGSFQALQHRLADMYVKREAAWSTVLYAAVALDEDLDEAVRSASIAKAYVSRAAREIVEGALQVLGGVGFTWEHDAHLLQRRVLECERRFGDSIDHECRLAEADRRSAAAAGAGGGAPAGSLLV